MKNDKRHMGDIGHMPLGGQESYQEMFFSSNSNMLGQACTDGRKDGSRNNIHTVLEKTAGSNKTRATNRQKPRKR